MSENIELKIEHIRHLTNHSGLPNFNIAKFEIVKHIPNKEMACDLCELEYKRYLKFYAGHGGGVVFGAKVLLCESCMKEVADLFKSAKKLLGE